MEMDEDKKVEAEIVDTKMMLEIQGEVDGVVPAGNLGVVLYLKAAGQQDGCLGADENMGFGAHGRIHATGVEDMDDEGVDELDVADVGDAVHAMDVVHQDVEK